MSQSKKTYQKQSSPSSSSPDEVSAQDIQKVQTLWNDIQQNKRQLEETQRSQTQNYRDSATGSLSHYITENQDLRDKLRQSEKQVNDGRDNVVILTRKLNEAEDELRAYRDNLSKQNTLTAMKTHQINRMTSQYENLNLSQKEIIERSRESNIALIHELEEKNREIDRLKTLARERVDKLSTVSVSHSQASSQINRLEDQIESQKDEIASLKRELQESRNTIVDLRQVKKSEGLAMIEIEHLRSDVQRLVKMLKTTKEYSDFADFADDNTGSIRFLKDTLRQTPVDTAYKRFSSSAGFGTSVGTSQSDNVHRLCVQEALVDEKEVWMPRDAFKFAAEFRRKYNGELTDELLEKLLHELNRLWARREQQRVQRVQTQCAHEIMKLKRKLSQHPTFNEVQAKQTINRLKSELKTSYKENKKAFDERVEVNPPGIHYVNETLKMAKNSHNMKKIMTQENDFLRSKIKTFSQKSQLGI